MIGFNVAPEVMEGVKGNRHHELDVGLEWGCQIRIDWSK